mgnify:CR=1 FL=1
MPFGYRYVFTSVVCFLLAYLWVKTTFPQRIEGNILSNVAVVFANITLIALWVIALKNIVLYLIRKLSQLELPPALHKVPGYAMAIYGLTSAAVFIFLIKFFAIPFVKTVFAYPVKEIVDNREVITKSLSGIIKAFVFYTAIPLILARLLPGLAMFRQKLNENKTFRQLFLEGRGGSAKWASIASFEKRQHPLDVLGAVAIDTDDDGQVTDTIILGKSLFDDDPAPRTIGIKDDAHMLTIGMTGSGKSTTVLLPNLAMYKGSTIVLDPKGELANKTYRRRSQAYDLESKNIHSNTKRHMKFGKCYVLDPFSETKGLPSNKYNLLSEIDINSDRVRELLSAISDGCVTPEKGDSKHFEELAKYFIEGVIAHVLSKYPQKHHNLPFVFDLVHGIDTDLKVADPTRFKELLYVMMKNDAAGGLPQQAASKLLEMGERERGSVLSTVSRSLKWIGDPAMRKHLIESDLRFWDFTYNTTHTAYIVLPDGLINEQMRWLRCLISVSIGVMRNAHKPSIPTLFILDEFPRLGGQINAVAEGFGILRGYGIKLWAFIQDIGQLQKDYPDRWSSITANSTVQVFGVNDIETAEWLSQNLGTAVQQRTDGREGVTKMYRKKVVHENVYPLLTPNEVMSKFGKNTNRQVVMPTDGLPMRLERLAYKPLSISGNKFRGYPLQFHFEDW